MLAFLTIIVFNFFLFFHTTLMFISHMKTLLHDKIFRLNKSSLKK